MNNGKHDKITALDFIVREFDDGVDGEFVWGLGRSPLFERFYTADELSNPELAKRALNKILRQDPQFVDAYNSLGWWEIEFANYGNAKELFDKAFNIGNDVIPKNFSGQIIWGIIDNRPFLRAMHGLGLCYLFTNDFNKALQVFNKMLGYNPNDNQGIRALAIHCNIALGRFNAILEICNKYPEDILPDTLYGKVLALYKLNKTTKAKEALKEAVICSPLVVKELVKKRHKKIKSEFPGSVTVGGADEAYDYWESLGQYWTDPDLIDFIKIGLKSLSQI